MQTYSVQTISGRMKRLIETLVLAKFTLVEISKITGLPEELIKQYIESNKAEVSLLIN